MRRALAALILLASCGALKPAPAEYDYWVLTPMATAPAASPAMATAAAQAPVLVLGRVRIPEYLQRESMATRVGTGQLVYSKRDRWAEPLEDGISRTLGDELGILLAPRVTVVPRRMGPPPDYTVAVDVLQFERIGPGEVGLDARYAIRAGAVLLHAGETRIAEPTDGDGPGPAAAALSRALSHLGRDIAAAVPAP